MEPNARVLPRPGLASKACSALVPDRIWVETLRALALYSETPVISNVFLGVRLRDGDLRREREKVAEDSRTRTEELSSQISQLLTENEILEREVRRLSQEKKTLLSQMELMKERLSRIQGEVVSGPESEKEKIKTILEKAREFEFEFGSESESEF